MYGGAAAGAGAAGAGAYAYSNGQSNSHDKKSAQIDPSTQTPAERNREMMMKAHASPSEIKRRSDRYAPVGARPGETPTRISTFLMSNSDSEFDMRLTRNQMAVPRDRPPPDGVNVTAHPDEEKFPGKYYVDDIGLERHDIIVPKYADQGGYYVFRSQVKKNKKGNASDAPIPNAHSSDSRYSKGSAVKNMPDIPRANSKNSNSTKSKPAMMELTAPKPAQPKDGSQAYLVEKKAATADSKSGSDAEVVKISAKKKLRRAVNKIKMAMAFGAFNQKGSKSEQQSGAASASSSSSAAAGAGAAAPVEVDMAPAPVAVRPRSKEETYADIKADVLSSLSLSNSKQLEASKPSSKDSAKPEGQGEKPE